MSPLTAKIVKLIGWQNICMAEDPSVIRGQFIKMYEIYMQRMRKDALLSPDLKRIIKQLTEHRHLQVIEGGKKDGKEISQ
jgi:hypothetical protein